MAQKSDQTQGEAIRAAQQAREQRLTPDAVAHWTRVIREAAKLVEPGKKPCDYAPWVKALCKVQGAPGPKRLDPYAHYELTFQFRRFFEAAARPTWPEPRRDLIEFAVLFLVSDVMLFRSGYAKRHFARRLQQSQLTKSDIDQIGIVLKRAVLDGAGLEEFRAYTKLFGALVARGHLVELADWMRETAKGAILTIDRADGLEWQQMYQANDRLGEDEKARLSQGSWLRPSKYGVEWPDMYPLVRAGAKTKEPDQKVRRNAYRMLRALRRRRQGIVPGKRAFPV